MADVKSLSDEELIAEYKKLNGEGDSVKSVKDLTDDELVAEYQRINSLDKVESEGGALDFLSKYTAAPAMAAFSELTRTHKEFAKPEPSLWNNIVGAGKAFANQFGEDPSLAPTGKDVLAKNAGISTKPIIDGTPSFGIAKGGIAPEAYAPQEMTKAEGLSPAGIGGLALDVAVDPLTVLPVGSMAKIAGKGIKGTTKLALEGSVAALEAAKKVPVAGLPIRAVASAAENTKLAASKLFNPKMADDFNDLKQIAEKNGIDTEALPESVEFGENSLISRMSRVQREGVLGEQLLDKFENSLNQVRKAVDNKVSNLSGGTVLSEAEAGAHLRQAYKKGADDFFKQMDVTYDKILAAYPGLGVKRESLERLQKKVGDIRKSLEERKKFAIGSAEKSQIATLEEALDILENTGAYKGFDTLRSVQKSIGRVAFGETNPLAKLDLDTAELRGLYREIKDVLIDTADTIKDKKGYKSALAKLEPDDLALKVETGKKLYAAEQLKKVLTGAQYMAGRDAYLDKFLEDARVLGFDDSQIQRIESLITNFDDVQRGGTAYDNLLKNVLSEIDQKEAAAKIADQYLYTKENAIHESIRTNMGDVADKLKKNNAAMSELFDDKSLLKNAIGGKNVSDEGAFRNAFNSTNKVQAIKRILKPEDMAVMKGAFLESLIKRDTEGGFSFRQLRNALRNKMDVAEEIFEPQELQEVLELIRLGDRYGISIMSTSGTGASNILKDIWKSLGASASNEAIIEALKGRARSSGVVQPSQGLKTPDEQVKLWRSIIGPQNISRQEAIGIRLPQQISIQQRNNERK